MRETSCMRLAGFGVWSHPGVGRFGRRLDLQRAARLRFLLAPLFVRS